MLTNSSIRRRPASACSACNCTFFSARIAASSDLTCSSDAFSAAFSASISSISPPTYTPLDGTITAARSRPTGTVETTLGRRLDLDDLACRRFFDNYHLTAQAEAVSRNHLASAERSQIPDEAAVGKPQ